MIVGTIDRISKIADSFNYRVGGWAYFKEEGGIVPAKIFANETIEFQSIHRGDCADDIDIGFEFVISVKNLINLLDGSILIKANHGNCTKDLGIWQPCKQKIRSIIFEDFLLQDADESSLRKALEIISSRLQTTCLQIEEKVSAQTPTCVGSLSMGGDVIVGAEGVLYLYKGSNNLNEQYDSEKNPAEDAEKWESIIKLRQEKCRELGVQFCQIIIPEKQSFHKNCYPNSPNKNTSLYLALHSRISKLPCFVDVNSSFKELYSAGEQPFRKVDSHLSITGLKSTLLAVFEKINLPLEFRDDRVVKRLATGDLGGKFFQAGGFLEDLEVPEPGYIVGAEFEPELIGYKDVPGHIGLERRWINHKAPFEKSVTIFGNSFFERGGDSLGLSYWFSRLFKSVNFIWTPTFDEGLVAENRSDIVICQTIERFLKYFPER